MIATSALRTCSRNTTQTIATMMVSSIKRPFERVDSAVDQVRAVVDRVEGDALRQTGAISASRCLTF